MRCFYLLLLTISIPVTFGSVCLFGLVGLVILGTISTTDLDGQTESITRFLYFCRYLVLTTLFD